jgi:hypothetical protein
VGQAAGGEPKKVNTIVNRPDQPVAGPSPQAAARAPDATEAGGYVVHVASQRTDADAQASYRALATKHPSVLGNRRALIKRVDLGERGVVYRAHVGPFSSAEEAGAMCSSLKDSGGQCVVLRN